MKYKKFIKENFFLLQNTDASLVDQMLSFDGILVEEFLPGEIILNSQTSEKIYLVYKGNAVIRSGDDGVILRKLTVGDSFGAASLFDKHTYNTTVLSNSSMQIISFSKEFVEKCIELEKTVSFNYISFLSKRISFLNRKIEAFTAKNAENKLYSYILNLPRKENDEVEITVSMSTLSKMLAIGRASLYRSFEKLEASGQITKYGKRIILNEV